MLTILLIISSILFLLLLWVVFTPLIIKIDTTSNIYELRLFGLLRVWLSLDNDIILHIKTLVYQFRLDVLKMKLQRSKKKVVHSNKKKSGSYALGLDRILTIIKSFRITKLELSLDTHDFALNAQLVPLCQLVNNRSLQISVNFMGRTYCQLELRNTLWRLGMAVVRPTRSLQFI
jgi:hypothetical protein